MYSKSSRISLYPETSSNTNNDDSSSKDLLTTNARDRPSWKLALLYSSTYLNIVYIIDQFEKDIWLKIHRQNEMKTKLIERQHRSSSKLSLSVSKNEGNLIQQHTQIVGLASEKERKISVVHQGKSLPLSMR